LLKLFLSPGNTAQFEKAVGSSRENNKNVRIYMDSPGRFFPLGY